MSLLTATSVDHSSTEKAPRAFAPAAARVRRDAMPWDAEILESASRHERTHEAPSTHAPAKGRVRRDAMPWDAEILESASHH